MADGGDAEARRHMSLASLFGGLAINLADCSAEHALGHGLGGVYGLPHGLAVGLMLAECLETNRPARVEELERIGEALGEPADDARRRHARHPRRPPRARRGRVPGLVGRSASTTGGWPT